ncbi:MAG: DUF92 domain-containing protein [Candidatus Micrarchaeota archaeon]
MNEIAQWLLSLIIVLVFAILAFKLSLLTETGTIAAILVGLCLFVLPVEPVPGWAWFGLLAAFFISSNAVTRFKKVQKEAVNQEFAKGSVRDLAQVIANGTVAIFLAAVYHFYPQPIVFTAFVAVVAVSNADTFATELGVLSKSKPFLITTFKRVENGASGAVSLLGTLAAFAGAAVIAAAAIALASLPSLSTGSFALAAPGGIPLFAAIIVFSGAVGSLADSFLGATIQAMYWCKRCKKETERKIHKCGEKTLLFRGIKWIDNDVVNLLSTIVGGALAAGLFYLVA